MATFHDKHNNPGNVIGLQQLTNSLEHHWFLQTEKKTTFSR